MTNDDTRRDLFSPYRRQFLKVKIKSLSEESRIIRAEEKKVANVYLMGQLHWHRTNDVRIESRAAQLAYGYLRGKTLKQVEKSADRPEWVDKRAISIVKKFGRLEAREGFVEWLK